MRPLEKANKRIKQWKAFTKSILWTMEYTGNCASPFCYLGLTIWRINSKPAWYTPFTISTHSLSTLQHNQQCHFYFLTLVYVTKYLQKGVRIYDSLFMSLAVGHKFPAHIPSIFFWDHSSKFFFFSGKQIDARFSHHGGGNGLGLRGITFGIASMRINFYF